VVTWACCNAIAFSVAGSFVFGDGAAPRNAVLRFFVFNRDRPADWDSIWFVAQELMKDLRQDPNWAFPVPTLNLLSGALLAAGMAVVARLLWKASPPPRVAQALFLATAVFVLTSKVFSPQYTIWLIPLAVLARPRWAPFVGWQLLEVVLTVMRYLYFVSLSDPGSGVPLGFFMGAVVARDLALVALMYAVVHEIRHPDDDDVRRTYGADPAGGVLVPAMTAP
jgi:uncharacterized membrane protein